MNENQLAEFNRGNIAKFKELSQLKRQTDALVAREKEIKAELEAAMDQHKIISIDNDFIKVTRIAESSTTSIDVKTLEKKENGLYEELLADYPKVSKRKAYVRFTVK